MDIGYENFNAKVYKTIKTGLGSDGSIALIIPYIVGT